MSHIVAEWHCTLENGIYEMFRYVIFQNNTLNIPKLSFWGFT